MRCTVLTLALVIFLQSKDTKAASTAPETTTDVSSTVEASTVEASRTSAVEASAVEASTTSTVDTSTTTTDDATKLFDDAQILYRAGDRQGAITRLTRCYELTHDVNVLYNLAQIHRELEHCREALDYYRRYIQAVPDGDPTNAAKLYTAQLSEQCSTDSPLPPPVANESNTKTVPSPVVIPSKTPPIALTGTTSPDVPRSRVWPTIGWISVGTAALSTVATGYFTVQALQAKKDTEKKGSVSYYDERKDDLFRNSICTGVFGTTAIVAVGLSIYSFVVAAPNERAKDKKLTNWSMSLSPNGALLSAQTLF
jgi:tetratricopeptide (TPR) repeat protein